MGILGHVPIIRLIVASASCMHADKPSRIIGMKGCRFLLTLQQIKDTDMQGIFPASG